MNRQEQLENIINLIPTVDQTKLETYLKLCDRLFIYNLVANLVPKEVKSQMVDIWKKTVMISIDEECKQRTEFLQFSPAGRLERLQNAPDGEDERLAAMNAWKLAEQLVSLKIDIDSDGDNGDNIENSTDF